MFEQYFSKEKHNKKFEWKEVINNLKIDNCICKGILYEISDDTQRIEPKYYQLLSTGKLYCYPSYNNGYIKELQLQFPKFSIINNNSINGFTLTSSQKTRTFFCESEQKAQMWANNLSKMTIKSFYSYNFQFLKLLGNGTFSQVWLVLCKEKLPYQHCALKIIKKKKIMDYTYGIENVVNEISIMNSLNHPHIVQTLGVYETMDEILILLEYLPGGSLAKALNKKDLDEEIVKELSYRLASTLSYLHDNKIIHRDLKPENIVLKSKDDLLSFKLIDFGLSERLIDNEYSNHKCGSAGYVAPEILHNGYHNLKADVFSLGALFFYIFTKNDLFTGLHINSIINANKECEYNFNINEWNKIPYEIQNLIKSMIEKNPLKRISSSDLLNNKFFSPIKKSTNSCKTLLVLKKINSNEKCPDHQRNLTIFTPEQESKKNELENEFSGEKRSKELTSNSLDSCGEIPEELEYYDIKGIIKNSKEFIANQEIKNSIEFLINRDNLNKENVYKKNKHFKKFKIHIPRRFDKKCPIKNDKKLNFNIQKSKMEADVSRNHSRSFSN